MGMFSGKQVPAVGISIGIERIFALLEQKWRSQGDIRERETQVRRTVHATLPGSAEAPCNVPSQVRCRPAAPLHARVRLLLPALPGQITCGTSRQLWRLALIGDSMPAHRCFKAYKDPVLVPAARLCRCW